MAPQRLDSINDQQYRGILCRGDSIDPRRAVGLEDSVTAFTRHRYTSYTSHSRDDNMLSSLVVTQGYLEGGSLYSVPSQNSLDAKDKVDVSYEINKTVIQ